MLALKVYVGKVKNQSSKNIACTTKTFKILILYSIDIS